MPARAVSNPQLIEITAATTTPGTTTAVELPIAATARHATEPRDPTPRPAAENRTETAQDASESTSIYIGGPCADEMRCKYRHRFATGPWTCAWNHPRVETP